MVTNQYFNSRMFFALAVLLVSNSGIAADSLDNLSESLIKLRGEVQALNSELSQKKLEHRGRMQSLERQRGDIEAQLNRDQVRFEKLKTTLEKNKIEAAKAGADSEGLKPVILNAVDELKVIVRNGMPFKINERTAELDEIKGQLIKGLIPAPKAVNRLWAFYEDEIRLTRDIGIYRQPINLNGDEQLADVAKLGMVMMFYRTGDEKYGYAQNQGGKWTLVPSDGREANDQIALLFDNLRKQIRTGYFVLPNTISMAGEVK